MDVCCSQLFTPSRYASSPARVLRAQKIDGQNILFWILKINQGVIAPAFSLPNLHFFKGGVNRAILFHALDAANDKASIVQDGFFYRVYSMQGPLQPLPIEDGDVCLGDLRRISRWQINYWKQICERYMFLDLDLLASTLLDRNYQNCIQFFLYWHDQIIRHGSSFHYSPNELLEVIYMIDPSSKQPLSKVLDEKSGTRKFGALLRQLHEANRGEYLESFEMLRIAKSPEDIRES